MIRIYSLCALIMMSSISCKMKSKQGNNKAAIDMIEEIGLPDWIDKEYVMGHFDPAQDDRFVEVDIAYADRAGLLLRVECYEAFVRMSKAAKEEGLDLQIRSATRNFDYQKRIWQKKWMGETILSDDTKASDIEDHKTRALKILLYSSMPGTSRHHWGTDIDLNSFDNRYFESGPGLNVYEWLTKNASSFGFCQPYTSKGRGRSGYEEEKWHWSFVPLSNDLTEYCRRHMTNLDIEGFDGSHVAEDVDMITNYVLGIDVQCQYPKSVDVR